MRPHFFKSFCFLPMAVCIQSAFADKLPKCDSTVKVTDVCSISLNHVHPSQFTVGQLEVDEKSKKIEEMSSKTRDAYLAKHPARIVVAPGDEIFIVDKHHLAKALFELHYEKMDAIVTENLSQDDETSFEKDMLKNHWTWLEDENGNPMSFSELPRHLDDLKDDLYRSLSWLVRDGKGYTKLDTEPWQDFLWADFLRKNVEIDSHDRSLTRATADGLKVAHSKKASSLPGYLP